MVLLLFEYKNPCARLQLWSRTNLPSLEEEVTMLSLAAFSLLVLLNLVVLDHLATKMLRRYGEWRKAKRFVGGHPEMQGVDLEHDPLVHYTADAALKAFVLDNDDPGEDRPFMSGLAGEFDDIDYD
ncbi:hypothetical protein [Synechococcus sp. NOUM97013]|uniref:hypothetical protein n=1 Tax=Synechococcus sp. NOUM97013 TaxID=1442555 RepID=UPI0016463868|nr:hypothetical protein [Synechococcus sp. NOUM97013]